MRAIDHHGTGGDHDADFPFVDARVLDRTLAGNQVEFPVVGVGQIDRRRLADTGDAIFAPQFSFCHFTSCVDAACIGTRL